MFSKLRKETRVFHVKKSIKRYCHWSNSQWIK